jgi:hypothetical protein
VTEALRRDRVGDRDPCLVVTSLATKSAAVLFASRDAVAACYWQPFGRRSALGVDLLEFVQDPASINQREEEIAREIAERGAALAARSELVGRRRSPGH